jgi:hypothetical protein
MENGAETITRKPIKKEVPVKIFIQKPTRSLRESGEEYYAITLSDNLTKGVISRALLEKRIREDGGILDTKEEKELENLTNKLIEAQTKISELGLETTKTEENKQNLKKLQDDIVEIQRKLQALYVRNQNIFENTAEERAQRKSLTWWILNLTYIQEDGDKEPKAYFSGNMNEKFKKLEIIEDGEDEFGLTIYSQVYFYVYLWLFQGLTSPEDFKKAQEKING